MFKLVSLKFCLVFLSLWFDCSYFPAILFSSLPFNSFCSVHFDSYSILFGAFEFYLFLLVQFDNMRNFHVSLDLVLVLVSS